MIKNVMNSHNGNRLNMRRKDVPSFFENVFWRADGLLELPSFSTLSGLFDEPCAQ